MNSSGTPQSGQKPWRHIRFLAIVASSFTSFVAMGALLPVLPPYMRDSLKAGDLAIGVLMGATAFTAILARPLAGSLTDQYGHRPVVLGGALLTALSSVLGLHEVGLERLFLSRLVLGLGEGLVFTAGGAWVVALSPEEYRGKALGLFGLSMWGGLTVGPLLGDATQRALGLEAVWLLLTLIPLLGGAAAWPVMAAPLVQKKQGNSRLIPREAMIPGVAFALANVGYGALASFGVLLAQERGFSNGSRLFMLFGASFVTSRLLASGLPDRWGPRQVAMMAASSEAVGLLLIATATHPAMAIVGAIIAGLGFALLYPALALAVVRTAAPESRGRAIGAFTAFWDLGLALTSPALGAIASAQGYPAAFMLGAACALGAACIGATLERKAHPLSSL
jgi:MFS family permease